MLRNKMIAVAAPLIALVFTVGAAAGQGQYVQGSDGVDISYPNCKTSVPSTDFGIVGVTGGLVYSHNSCLAKEASAFTNLSFYINTGLNASKSSSYYKSALSACNNDAACAAHTYGYNAALDALSYASSQGLDVHSGMWWLDVETSNTWTTDTSMNQASLTGAYDALNDGGISSVGVYSTTAQWGDVTGSWQNNWPSWGATTWTTANQASKYCTGHEFTGGPSYLMQYKSKRSKVDQDYAC